MEIYQPRINKADMRFSRVFTTYAKWWLGALMIISGVILFGIGSVWSSWFLILGTLTLGAGTFVYYDANHRINEAEANRINYHWPQSDEKYNSRHPATVTRLNPTFEDSLQGRESICDNPA